MIPQVLVFLLTYKCNFHCAHCSVEGSNEREESLGKKYIKRALNDTEKIPTFKVVSFTGGEPTLEMNTLDWAIKCSSKKGLVTRLVTNGWWAENYEEAFEFLSKLKDAGLNEFNMSFGEFHLPYLKDEMKLVYAIKSAQDLGLRCAVANVQTRNSKINVPYIINLLKKEKIDTSKVLFVTDYVAPTGRGRLIPDELLVRGNRPDEIGCFEILKALSIHPNGDIHLCCGQAMLEIPELLGGNIKNNSIVEVVIKAQKNLLYWWLFAKGPKGIIEEITGKSDKYVNICDACRILFAKHRKELYKKIENEKYEILLHDIIESDFLKRLKKAYDFVEEEAKREIGDIGAATERN